MFGGFVPTTSFTEALLTEQDDSFMVFEVECRLKQDALDLNQPWNSATYNLLRNYLTARKPRMQLEQIRVALGEYRKTPEQNFSIAEILPMVGRKELDRDSQRLR